MAHVRPASLGDPGNRVVVKGLSVGERVIVSGASLLTTATGCASSRSGRSRDEEIVRTTHNTARFFTETRHVAG